MTTASVADDAAIDPLAMVEAWRAASAAPVDPVRFCVIEGLARRATMQQGEARRLLLRRVEELLAEHAAARPTVSQHVTTQDEPKPRQAVLASLTELVDRLGAVSTSTAPPRSPTSPGAANQTDAPRTASPARMALPTSLKAVTAFKGTWSRLRADQRLRQALAQVPTMAGPLNSSHVLNKALQTMRDLSPEYLDAFMLHVDTLLWLEQASGGATDPTPRTTTPAEGRRSPVARGARKG